MLDNFSSGSLSPVSDYFDSEAEAEAEEENLEGEFRGLLRAGDESKILKFIEGSNVSINVGAGSTIQSKFLHIAVEERCRELEVFKSLLRVGCDPLEVNSAQKTALTLLLELKEFDDRDFEEDGQISTLLGEWELRRAATRESKVFKLIHARNWKDFYGHLRALEDDEAAVNLLCRPDPKYAGISPLHEIAASNNVAFLKKLLAKYPTLDLNVKAIGSGNTLLHEATHMTCTEMVTFLLEMGVRCNVKNAAGRIPAHLGTEKIQVIIEIRHMMQQSSSTDSMKGGFEGLKNKDHKEQKDNKDEMNNHTHHKSTDSIQEEQQTANDDFNVLLQRESHSGRTILHRYARRNQTQKLLKFLKVNDFSDARCKDLKLFEVIDNSGHTPLHDAAAEGSLECAKVFLFGCSGSIHKRRLLMDPSIQAAVTKDTPLHLAAEAGHVDMIELLLQVGASKEAANIEDKRPADVCKMKSAVKKLLCGNVEVDSDSDIVKKKKKQRGEKTHVTIDTNTSMPVKRGPGRPRKYPRPDDHDKVPKSKDSPTHHTPPSAQSQLTLKSPLKLPLQEILPCKARCLLLVKFQSADWLLPASQFLALYTHLNAIYADNTIPADGLFIEITESQRRDLRGLPRVGPLVDLLLQTTANDLRFVAKSAALQLLESKFNIALTGPFGYLHIPKLYSQNHPQVYGGCPLKLKMKRQRDLVIGKDQANWVSHLAAEEKEFRPKSPKSFII